MSSGPGIIAREVTQKDTVLTRNGGNSGLKYYVSWLAASVFFFAGCLMSAAPAWIRAGLYSARITTGSWSYPDEVLERMVPAWPASVGILAFSLCGVALILPFFIHRVQPIDGPEGNAGP